MRQVQQILAEANHRHRSAPHTDNCGNSTIGNGERSCVNHQKLRSKYEDVRYDEGRNRQLRSNNTSTHRVCTGDTSAGISSQSNRRRYVSNDTKVERKHMRCQHRNIHLHQSRSGNRRSDNVVSSGRNAHAQNQRGNHREEHSRQQLSACQVKQRSRNLQANAGLGYNADDDTGSCTGNQYAQHALRAINQALDNLTKADARGFTQACADNRQRDSSQGCTHRRIAADEQVNDNNQRNSQMAFFYK